MPVLPGAALRWGGAEAARSRLGLRARRAPPRQQARYCLPWQRPVTSRSCTSGQPADGGEHQGNQHRGEPSTRGLRPRAPVCMDCRPRCFNPSLPTRHAAGSSLHQLGEDPAPRVRARLRGLRFEDGRGRADTRAAVWLRLLRSILSPSARTGLADQSPRAKVVRPAGRSTLTRGLSPATRRVADGERMNLHPGTARSRQEKRRRAPGRRREQEASCTATGYSNPPRRRRLWPTPDTTATLGQQGTGRTLPTICNQTACTP